MNSEQRHPITRELFGKTYQLIDSVRYERQGRLYKNTYWKEIVSSDATENPDTITIECRIPAGYVDIDVTQLSESCIKPGVVIDEPVLR